MKPKLAFVSLWNAADPDIESGYAYSMRRQLQKRFDVADVFPLPLPGENFWLPVRAAYRLSGRYYHPMREPSLLKRLSRQIERSLARVKPDVVFSPSSIPMSFVETRLPWMYASDQLFCDFIGSYIKRPAGRFLRLGESQETRALAWAARATFPSDCTAQTAIGHYGANPSKIAVIPWGANLPSEIAEAEVTAAIAGRRPEACRLVFIGRDWQRKGGDRFVAVVRELNRQGLSTHGTIIGSDAPGLSQDAAFTIYSRLDKSRPAAFVLFANALASAHFLVAPSRAEAYGQALCEAAAFGVPSAASAVGGIPTILRDGETGLLLPPDATASDFANRIREMVEAPERYARMALAARADYRTRLNWDSFGAALSQTVAALL